MKTTHEQGNATQKRIMDCITGYIEEHGYPPTVREICAITGIRSTSNVHHHITKMIAKGELESDSGEGSSRALRVPGYKFVKVAEG